MLRKKNPFQKKICFGYKSIKIVNRVENRFVNISVSSVSSNLNNNKKTLGPFSPESNDEIYLGTVSEL